MIKKDNVITCLTNIGCIVDENTDDLKEVIEDSIMYVSFIVELEEMFDIEIPDDYLFLGAMSSISSICDMLNEIIGMKVVLCHQEL